MRVIILSTHRCFSQDIVKTEEVDETKSIVRSDLTIIEEDGSMSDDQGVESLAHAQAILEAEDDAHYQWKSDDGGKQDYEI